MAYENYNFGEGGPNADYYGPQPFPYGDGMPPGLDEHAQFQMGVADAIWRDMEARASAAQAAQYTQPVEFTSNPTPVVDPENYTAAQPNVPPTFSGDLSQRLFVGSRFETTPANTSPAYDPARRRDYFPAPLDAPETQPEPMTEPRRGSYRKAIAAVALVGGVLTAAVTGFNHLTSHDEPKGKPASAAPAQPTHPAISCQLTSAKEINSGTAEFTLAQPINPSQHKIEVGVVNNVNEWTQYTSVLPVKGEPNKFVFSPNGLEYNRLVVKVGGSMCQGAFGLAPENTGDAWFSPAS
jgi:hypothetical protein